MGVTLSEDRKAALGAFYTPDHVAEALVRMVREPWMHTALEPSAGDGAFCRHLRGMDTVAVEVDPESAAALDGKAGRVICADFLTTDEHADLVIGNPPYVRLRNVSESQRRAARSVMEESGWTWSAVVSMWLPFVLHAVKSVNTGGALALVIPWEVTTLDYARPLWGYLAERFASVEVHRSRERIFPDLNQDVAVLVARGRGGVATSLRVLAGDRLGLATATELPLDAGPRDFTMALLPPDLSADVSRLLAGTGSSGAAYGVGYISGASDFFHPDARTVEEYGIPESDLVEVVVNAAQLRGAGVWTSGVRPRVLWYPRALVGPSADYAARGAEMGVDQTYKARHRTPWWRCPLTRPPDVVANVLSDTPTMMVNDAALPTTNSILNVFTPNPEGFVRRWYTPQTRVEIELTVRSLGGGVLTMVPGDLGRLSLPAEPPTDLADVDACLRAGRPADAYHLGDTATPGAESLWEAVDVLRGWRRK